MLRLAFVHAWVWHTKLVCHIDRHRLKIQPCLVEEDGVLRILDFDWHCGCVRDDGVHFDGTNASILARTVSFMIFIISSEISAIRLRKCARLE